MSTKTATTTRHYSNVKSHLGRLDDGTYMSTFVGEGFVAEIDLAQKQGWVILDNLTECMITNASLHASVVKLDAVVNDTQTIQINIIPSKEEDSICVAEVSFFDEITPRTYNTVPYGKHNVTIEIDSVTKTIITTNSQILMKSTHDSVVTVLFNARVLSFQGVPYHLGGERYHLTASMDGDDIKYECDGFGILATYNRKKDKHILFITKKQQK